MSDLLKSKKKPKENNILKQIFGFYKQKKSKGHKSFRVLYIFTSDTKQRIIN